MNNIERATLDDIPQIVSFGFASFYENNLAEASGQTPDFQKALFSLSQAVNEDIVFIKRDEDTPTLIEGVFVLKVETTWWSDEPVLWSNLLFIRKDKRSYKLAKDFLDTAKEYAILNKMPLVFELFAQTDVQKKIKLLKRLGFTECGSYLIFKA